MTIFSFVEIENKIAGNQKSIGRDFKMYPSGEPHVV